MQKDEIIQKVKELNLPEGEFVVISSGILGALELREVNDVDLVVTPEVLAEFENKDGWEKEVKWGKTFLSKGVYDMFSQLAWDEYETTCRQAIDSARMIAGVPFMNIEETIKFKRALGRKKDERDIILLREYQQSQPSS